MKHVEPLIGSETVNTMPIETLEAYRDHGNPASRIDKAHEVMRSLREIEVDLPEITQRLEDEGVEKFLKPFTKLMEEIEYKGAPVSAH